MPISTEELLQQYLRGTRPSRIPIFQTGAMMDNSFTATPLPEIEPIKFPTPEGYTVVRPTPRQRRSDIAAQTEVRRGLGLLSTTPGGLEEAETQYRARLPEASSTIMQPIFDVLQSGQFAMMGAIQELIRGGTAWDAFKRASIEFANAMPFIEIEEATRPVGSDILKELNVFSEDGYGPWGSAVGGFLLDIFLDPMTYVGASVAKAGLKTIKAGTLGVTGAAVPSLRGKSAEEVAKSIRRTAPVDWFRKTFIPDVAIKDLKYAERLKDGTLDPAMAAEKYLDLRTLTRARSLSEFDTMRDTVVQLVSGLAPEEKRLLGIYLDQPTRIKNLVGSVSTDVQTRGRLMEKANAFRSHYLDLAKKESEAGLLDPAIWRSNYLAGRDPTTKLSAKAWDQFAKERGLRSQAAQLPGVAELPIAVERTGAETTQAIMGRGRGSVFARPIQGQATPTFEQAKQFQTNEERVRAAVPTELDIGLSTAQRSLEHVRHMNTKRFVSAVLSDPIIARRIVDDEKLLLDSRSFHEALAEKGYGIMDAPHWEKGTSPYILPLPIVEDLRKADKIFSDNKEAAAFFQHTGTITNWWKGWALFSPGFHFRNMYSNIFNNWLADVKDPIRYGQALGAMTGMEGEIITKAGEKIPFAKIIEEMKDQGVYSLPVRDLDLPRQVESELYGILQKGTRPAAEVSTQGELGQAVAASVGLEGPAGGSVSVGGLLRSLGPSGPVMEWNRKIGSTVEDWSRVAHYVDKRIKGFDSALAGRSVKKYLFDYTELTPTERDYLKPLIPFYTWSRKNIPLQLQALITNPGKYARVPKLKQEIESVSRDWENIPTPDYFQEIIAIRMPQGLSETFGGEPVYLNPNLPFQDLNRMNWKDILSQMNPFIKFVGEWGSGYSVFLDRPIEKYPGEIDETSPLGLSKKKEYFLQTLAPPYGKVARIIKSASPQKDTLGEQLLTEGLGIKLIGVDVEAVKRAKNLKMRDAVRSAIDKMRDMGWLLPARER